MKEASSIVTHNQHWERLALPPLISWLLTCWICLAVSSSRLPQGGHRGLTGWGSDEDPPRTMGLPSYVWGCEWVHVRVCMCVQSIFYCCSHQKKSRDRILYLCFLLGFFGRWIPGFTTWGESAHSSSSLSCNPPSGSLLGRLDCDEFLETIYEDGEMDISSCDTTMHKDKPGLFKHYRSWLLALSAKLRPGKLDWMFRITAHFLWDLPLQLSLATLEEPLRDHFVCGLRHDTIKDVCYRKQLWFTTRPWISQRGWKLPIKTRRPSECLNPLSKP